MNWFRRAQSEASPLNIVDFKTRGEANAAIREYEEILSNIVEASNISLHSNTNAKKIIDSVLESKRIESYPSVKKVLTEANKKVYDNPSLFSELCYQAADYIDVKIIQDLKIKRYNFANPVENKDNVNKGIQD